MKIDEFIAIIKQPETVEVKQSRELEKITEIYPYFAPAQLLSSKANMLSESILAVSSVEQAAIYSFDRRWLYFYLYPERKLSERNYKRENHTQASGGDYFDMLDRVERQGADSRKSLRELAEQLKMARELITTTPAKSSTDSSEIVSLQPEMTGFVPVQEEIYRQQHLSKPDNSFAESITTVHEISENYAKMLIKEKKYSQAIVVLKKLNLINPKKSVYFADQIRFLEKVISTTKK